jgi:hypothetical protein
LANVTAKASCTRSPWVRLNGMFNALVWSFDFDLIYVTCRMKCESLIPVKVPLGGGRYTELTEWNGSKRVDLRFLGNRYDSYQVWCQLVFV